MPLHPTLDDVAQEFKARMEDIQGRQARRVQERADEKHIKRIERCRKDPNAFMRYAMGFRQAKIHRDGHAHISAHHRAMIEFPREHGKTEQFVVGRVLWELGNDTELRIKIICNDDDSATKRIVAIRTHIQHNPRVREVFPHLRPHPEIEVWTKHELIVDRLRIDKDNSVEAYGILGTAVGGRCDLMIFDDVVDFQNAIAKPSMRQMVIDAFSNVWINLLSREGRAIYIATPWHEADLTAYLENHPEWALYKVPIDENLTPIWPEQWPKARLEQRLREILPRAFARGFRLLALSDEDALLRGILSCLRPDLYRRNIQAYWRTFTGIDLGHSKRKNKTKKGKERPYSVIFTIAVDPDDNRWPVDIRRGHWSGPETARQVLEVNAKHTPEAILFENNAYQDTFGDWLKLVDPGVALPLKPFTTGAQKMDEEIGLPGLAAEFDAGKWIIPTEGKTEADLAHDKSTLGIWIDEARNWPAAPLSDTVMASWLAREAVRRPQARFEKVLTRPAIRMAHMARFAGFA